MKGPFPLLFVLWFPHTTVVQSFLLHKKGGCTTSSKPCGLIAPFLSSDLSIQPFEENVLMWNPRTTMGSAITTNYQQTKYAKIMAESSPSTLTFLNSNVQAWLSLSMPLSSSSLPSTTILVASESTEIQQPPTKEEIKLLRQAFAVFYGVDRDLTQAEQLLSEAIQVWQRQPPDELAGLYRVRGDCYMVGWKWKREGKKKPELHTTFQYREVIVLRIQRLFCFFINRCPFCKVDDLTPKFPPPLYIRFWIP